MTCGQGNSASTLFTACSGSCLIHATHMARMLQTIMGMGSLDMLLVHASVCIQRQLDRWESSFRMACIRAPKLAGPLRNSVPRSASGTSPSTSSTQYSNSLFWLVKAAAQSSARKRTPSARFGVPASGASGTGCVQQDTRFKFSRCKLCVTRPGPQVSVLLLPVHWQHSKHRRS